MQLLQRLPLLTASTKEPFSLKHWLVWASGVRHCVESLHYVAEPVAGANVAYVQHDAMPLRVLQDTHALKGQCALVVYLCPVWCPDYGEAPAPCFFQGQHIQHNHLQPVLVFQQHLSLYKSLLQLSLVLASCLSIENLQTPWGPLLVTALWLTAATDALL